MTTGIRKKIANENLAQLQYQAASLQQLLSEAVLLLKEKGVPVEMTHEIRPCWIKHLPETNENTKLHIHFTSAREGSWKDQFDDGALPKSASGHHLFSSGSFMRMNQMNVALLYEVDGSGREIPMQAMCYTLLLRISPTQVVEVVMDCFNCVTAPVIQPAQSVEIVNRKSNNTLYGLEENQLAYRIAFGLIDPKTVTTSVIFRLSLPFPSRYFATPQELADLAVELITMRDRQEHKQNTK